MVPAEEEQTSIVLEGGLKKGIIHCGGVGGGTALVLYTQSWYADTLQTSLPLLVLGFVFWIVTIGALSWTISEFIIPAFIYSRN